MSSEGTLDLVREAAHIFSQRRVIGALMGTVARSAWRARPGARPATLPALPGPELTERVVSPSPELVRDYARFLGASAESFRSSATVPAHLFPQWTFPIAARVLRGLPYDLTRILNAGCRLQMNASVPAASPLTVRAQLVEVRDDGRRALLHQRVVTDTPSYAGALVADLYAVAPAGPSRTSSRSRQSERSDRDSAAVPADAREIGRFHVSPRAGLAFALLTGDFNPVHWVAPFARASGFSTPILHGFAMMARALDGLERALYAGATDRIAAIDVKFKRPLVLGHGTDLGLYLDRAQPACFYLANAPGVRPYVSGCFETRQEEIQPTRLAGAGGRAPSGHRAALAPFVTERVPGERHA
jgi:acyl dehydratase